MASNLYYFKLIRMFGVEPDPILLYRSFNPREDFRRIWNQNAYFPTIAYEDIVSKIGAILRHH